MAIWDKNEPPATPGNTPAPQASTPPVQPQPARTGSSKEESLITSGITIEGKIVGKGSVRVAGKFKGDIHVDGDLNIDAAASVEGQVNAGQIAINGTLQGNIQNAKHVELKQGSTVTGDIKAGSLSVTAGARMRGNVDFGFEGK
ncbi:MAG TPA: polymer-forming cytoskeletal protein [Candidatus Acidoferrum sp.]|nr:polymer-forming cytoskeletal protein [Candidatus Acidoferrum sp.]